jgi:pilus assembly protein CpaC
MRQPAAFLYVLFTATAALAAEELTLSVGQSVVIDCASDIGRISTANPDVVDAVAVSTREVLLNAKAQGASTVVIWPKNGPRSLYAVSVSQDLGPLRQLLRESFPDLTLSVHMIRDTQTKESQGRDAISLDGEVPSKEVAERAAALMAPFAKVVVSNLRVVTHAPDKQILLRVKFAELDRNAATSFGVNLISTGAANTPGSISTGQFQTPRPAELSGVIPGRAEGTSTKFSISDALNVFAFRPDFNLSAFIKALQNEGLLQILAEPNLVATNGKEASFLVGGEFPVPVVQGGANAGSVSIMFKEFGIRLAFQPVLTTHGTIRMHVKPEVSTIDLTNAVNFSGFTIPALATRRAETDIELSERQSFVIAGLLDNRVTETMARIPGLAGIPILGELFKSRQTNRTRSELVVVVTPEITTPLEAGRAAALPEMPKLFLPERAPGKKPAPRAGSAKRNGR